ncbi:MAG: hypothetical protein H6811_06600 [Phycisphaeraceae bacterium]|nr:hypothetical protein [Phycisphaeraceae bacterium]
MTLHELIENAVLDSMGLLDEAEQASFEMALSASPPGVQAHVRREQARLCRLDTLLPDVEPPAGLRSAVVEAVRDAMAEEALSSDDLNPTRRAALELLPSRKVSPLWRMMAVASMAAAVVLGVVSLQTFSWIGQIRQGVASNQLLDQIAQRFGVNYVNDMLMGEQTVRVALRATGEGVRSEGGFWVHPDWDSALLFCSQLPLESGREFRLAVIDEDGTVVQELRKFNATGGLENERIEMKFDRAYPATARLAVLSGAEADATPVLVSQPGLSFAKEV